MAKDKRRGETLWREWPGEAPSSGGSFVYFYTEDHIGFEHDVVARALASALQRDGIVDSLGQGYRKVESSVVSHLYAGTNETTDDLIICSEAGETFYGDFVEEPVAITLVGVYVETY